MNKHILLWLALFFTVFLNGQTVTVTDKESNQPLELVTLFSENPKASVVTNVHGQANISNFEGSQKISIRYLGYKTITASYSELQSAGFKIMMETSNLDLNEVVLSATRWRQVSNNVPARIITINPKEISLKNPQTAADLLGISGQVFIQKSQQGGGSPMIRGFATNRLLYTVDGIRMNTAIFRTGNIQNVINIDPFATESTEVLFGSGSVIYGSDAIGGVMSFQTLTPQFSLNDNILLKGKALTRYASANNEKTGHFDINVGWKNWALVTSFSSWDFDNLKQGSHGPEDYIKPYYIQRQGDEDVVIKQEDQLLQIPSAYSQINLMQKVRFKPGDKWDFQYGFHYSETSSYGRYDRHNRMKNGLPRYAEWNYGPQIWMMNNLSINHHDKYSFYDDMAIRLANQFFEESRIDRSLNDIERNTQTEKLRAWSANIDFTKKTGRKQTFYYGLEYVVNNVNSTGFLTNITDNSTEKGPSRYPKSKWKSMAVYINDEFILNDLITLEAGLRYNRYSLNADFTNNLAFYPFSFSKSNINNSALTASIGGVYHPSKKWELRTHFSTAFRSPNIDDIGKIFDSEPGAVTIPNPKLKAEYAYSFDAGMARIIGEVVKLDLSAYYILLKNAMVRRDFTLNGQDSIVYDGVLSRIQTIQNAAHAKVIGIQAGLEIKLPAGFGFSSDLNYQHGEEELDDGSTSASRHAAPLFGLTKLNYHTNKLDLELYAQYQGKRNFNDLPLEEQAKDDIYAKDVNGNNYAPSWYTLNLKALYSLTKNFSLSAGLENITDQRYRPYSSGISGAGRNYVMAVTAKF